MRDIELFLNALAARVIEARVGGLPLNDATDFRVWLSHCAQHAARAGSMEEFFRAIDGEQTPRRDATIIEGTPAVRNSTG